MFRFPGPILVSASAALLSIAGAAYSANDGSRTVARPAASDSLIQRTYRWRLIGPDKGGRSIGVSGRARASTCCQSGRCASARRKWHAGWPRY